MISFLKDSTRLVSLQLYTMHVSVVSCFELMYKIYLAYANAMNKTSIKVNIRWKYKSIATTDNRKIDKYNRFQLGRNHVNTIFRDRSIRTHRMFTTNILVSLAESRGVLTGNRTWKLSARVSSLTCQSFAHCGPFRRIFRIKCSYT